MSRVVCRLPKAGLGNQLFPLLKAFVFAELNGLPVTVTGYHQLKIGPWLRREKTKRQYSGYFTFQKNLVAALAEERKILNNNNEKINEPEVAKIDIQQNTHYVFSAMSHWENYFEGLKENRALVKELFPKLVRTEVMEQVNVLQAPCIGVHIRMGDFRKLKQEEDFSKVGAVRTPEQYFIEVIKGIRKLHGSVLPVAVFTDGYKEEFEQLFSMENVKLIEGNSDMVDMILLSRSQIIVTSAGSTFSYWSGFLSDAPVIMHPDHLHESLRPEEVNAKWYEGPFEEGNELLLKNINAISFLPSPLERERG